MSIVRYRQWPTQPDIRHLLAPLLETPREAVAGGRWQPAVDIHEQQDGFVLHADLPGVDPASIELQMDKNVLSIRGERSAPLAADGERFSRIERGQGAFERRFALPDSADAEGIAARSRDGVLEVRIPKRVEAAPRRIPIEAGTGGG
ncbi:Hsp20/alpha crystallin family protein [Stenotrophomonas mori]|uniref:Hsp20/alpha crystallin family protein n=1 Tax=Stenotrophomonas mori TaxID=2871096 RepID=A0ABT0SEG1_9GAMM|nr:Hsp20/alpha crystallin family protein [Stenotrophomonas mori]MCL7713473.1 Hsp20/alpha crystallin family protein [Stenotrophomonas mori]